MRKLELELDGVKANARLLDNRAPNTCQALWDVLPYEDMVTHARWSGGRLHTNKHPNLSLDVSKYPMIENPAAWQAPGDIVVMPLINEITISYTPSKFAWMGETWIVTKIGVIEGEWTDFALKIDRLQWEGAKKLVIRRGAEDEAPVSSVAAGDGPRIEIEFDGKKFVAELFADRAPKLCNAILKAMPLEGPVTNNHSSGEICHYWVNIPNIPEEIETARERWVVHYAGKPMGTSAVAFYDPREMRGHNTGDILFCADEGLLLVHGQGQFGQFGYAGLGKGSGRIGQATTQKVGRIIEGDPGDVSAVCDRIEWEGAKTMRMRRI